VARSVNMEVHAIRREAFVEAAQRLIQAKGYERMSIQDVLDELGASRGAFYHYFESKAALVAAVVDRMVDEATAASAPIVDDPGLPVVVKLDAVVGGLAQWKGERTDLVLALLRGWPADENAVVREQFRRGLVARLAPMLARIARQAQAEGLSPAGAPEDIARVLVSLIQGANETAVELYFARRAETVSFAAVERTLAAYAGAFDRVLGLPAGSFPMADRATLRQWYG